MKGLNYSNKENRNKFWGIKIYNKKKEKCS